MYRTANTKCLRLCLFLCVLFVPSLLPAGPVDPVQPWKSEIEFPEDPFRSWTSVPYIKFTIIIKEGFDPNIVYYQDSQIYTYHYDFAVECLDPFKGMTLSDYDSVTLYESGQQGILGAIILPPLQEPPFNEYGIQFVRYDPYLKEEITQMFNLVKSSVIADPNVRAFYFPTYEQYPTAQQNREWFEAQGVPIGSTARWAEGNAGYSNGWTLGVLKFVPGNQIQAAYVAGDLLPDDILLTDGVPSEVPSVAGIITLMPSTPNSHVAILAQAQGVPFVHLALEDDAARAQVLVGRMVYLAVITEAWDIWCNVKLLDVESLAEQDKAAILALKQTPQLEISPMMHYGAFSADTNDLQPSDISYFGGKAANFGVLRQAVPDNSSPAMAFSFDLWNAFLDQPLSSVAPITIAPGQHLLFWADGDPEQGSNHTSFKLSRDGEAIGLYDIDATTLIDGLTYGPQSGDVSFGRTVDGGGQWQLFDNPTPGRANSTSSDGKGLVINEFMADNEETIEDPDEPGEFPDWIELYNGSDSTIILSGMFLTDDLSEPTKWQIPTAVSGTTLREEISLRLSKYTTYPPSDLKALSADLATIRNLFTNSRVIDFSPQLRDVVIDALWGFGFNPKEKLRFRSSTNVEDSEQFTGAGLYESYSGCLADELDNDDAGPCACDSSDGSERGVFMAIRKVFASFYNDNAFLERIRYGVNEADVGMALLVHHSFPDEIELANGVATMERSRSNWQVNLVCQKGAVSVTNPPMDAVPEQVRLEAGFQDVIVWLVQSSSLVSLREGTVLKWEDDYLELYGLLTKAGDRYSQLRDKDELVLDFEFKKVAPDGKLILKQLREIPRAGSAEYSTPFLLSGQVQYWTLQGRGGDVFRNHRLKSRWTLRPKNVWLGEENLQECLYADMEIEYVADGRIQRISAEMPMLPDAEHTYEKPQSDFDNFTVTDSWRFPDLCNPRTYKLRTQPLFGATVTDPIVKLSDMLLRVDVEYVKPVPLNDLETTTSDTVDLYEPWQPGEDDVLEEYSFDDPNTGVSITTRCFVRWGFGYASPTSVQFDATRIEGLTNEPIFLKGYFSQSVGGGSHLCPKYFLFEPELEPGISQQILDELRANDIHLIYFETGARDCRPTEWEDIGPSIRFYGFGDDTCYPADLDSNGKTD